MTDTTHHQLDHLRLEWRSLSHSRASRQAAEALSESYPPLQAREVRDLGDVVDLLEPNGPLSQVERAHLAAALLHQAPSNPLITRALLQTLLPGIVAVARRLNWGLGGDGEPATFLADLITTTYELIVEWGGQNRPYAAPDLLNAARCRMRRRMRTTDARRTVSLDALSEETSIIPGCVDEDPTESIHAQLLAAKGTVDPVGAAALYGREVLGLTYRELASMTGVSSRRLAAAGREAARRIWG